MNTKYLCILFPVLLSGCAPLAQTHGTSLQRPVAENTLNLLDGIELKKISDIDQHLKVIKDSRIEDVAQGIAEVDEWLFAPEDEKPARERIENEIEKLRTRIETDVTMLTKASLEAPDGKTATEKMSKINSLLSLYPAPKTDEQRAKLAQITSNILNTSRRVEDIRRLRYNEWAISKIQDSLLKYRYELQINNISDLKKLLSPNKEVLMRACIYRMSAINPAFLEPAVMDLYSYVFGLTRDAMGSDDEYLIKLTKGFANPSTERKTPSDF